MNTVKVVLFDLDETLFDQEHSRLSAVKMVHATYTCFTPYQFTQFEQDLYIVLEELWPHVLERTMTMETRLHEGFHRLTMQYGLENMDCADMAACYRKTYLEARQPIAGAVQLMEILKPNVRIGIITNHILKEQQEKLIACKLDPFVDFMVCAGELGFRKPDRRIFEHALEQAGCTVQETVMVGDSWSSDILGATALGMCAVWFNRAKQPCPDPALAIEIQSLEPADKVADILMNCP